MGATGSGVACTLGLATDGDSALVGDALPSLLTDGEADGLPPALHAASTVTRTRVTAPAVRRTIVMAWLPGYLDVTGGSARTKQGRGATGRRNRSFDPSVVRRSS
jgi:hypothetical protein